MEYQEFKEKMREKLQERYGEGTKIEIKEVLKNNCRRDGIMALPKDMKHGISPILYMDELYKAFDKEGMTLEECTEGVYRALEGHRHPAEVPAFAEKLMDWEAAKGMVYPFLLPAEGNGALLDKLAAVPMLDLYVAYMVRAALPGMGSANVKVTKKLLEVYGISLQELHGQAMENMRKDGYGFRNISDVVRELVAEADIYMEEPGTELPMYVLTNGSKLYGAAGILDKELVEGFAEGRDYYILPSSTHETIFVPADRGYDYGVLDKMVAEVNATQVEREERLTSHSYYYDGKTGDIRMCA